MSGLPVQAAGDRRSRATAKREKLMALIVNYGSAVRKAESHWLLLNDEPVAWEAERQRLSQAAEQAFQAVLDAVYGWKR